jgi:hypothetical protein
VRRRRARRTVATIEEHSTVYVGRRGEAGVTIHALTGSGVEPLCSDARFGSRELDWAGEIPAVELSHLLLSRLTGLRPTGALAARFAVLVLMEFPATGMHLEALRILEWLAIESSAADWASPLGRDSR